MKKKAIFLDRDGTLNRDTGYVHTKEAWEWLAYVPESLAKLKAAGWLLIVVSNQSGIARGMFSESDLAALEQWVNSILVNMHAEIDAWYHCPHLPEITGSCSCRKPKPGMLLHAAYEHNLDLTRCWMVGDAKRDVEAGLACGTKVIKLGRPKEEQIPWFNLHKVPICADLKSAVSLILQTCYC